MRRREIVAALLALALLVVVAAATLRLAPLGHADSRYGDVVAQVSPIARKTPNAISAVNFDIRGLDTLGEEFILFSAVAGLSLVLRRDRERTTEEALPQARELHDVSRGDAVKAFTALGIGLIIAFGCYLGSQPHLTPGGGFQGGAIAASASVIVMLGLGYRAFAKLYPQDASEIAEAIGAGWYALVGFATLLLGGSFLINALPQGEEGQLFSSGTIAVINLGVFLEVFAGYVVTFVEFARETRVELPAPDESG